jgi:hypothetical protein
MHWDPWAAHPSELAGLFGVRRVPRDPLAQGLELCKQRRSPVLDVMLRFGGPHRIRDDYTVAQRWRTKLRSHDRLLDPKALPRIRA